MANRKQKTQEIWKKRRKWATKHVFKPALKFTKAASKQVWRLIKRTWKEIHKKPRGRWKQPQPLMVPAPYVLCIGIVLVMAASLMGVKRDSACVLREGVGSPRIQRYWPAVRQWCSLIMEASDTYQLDPHLLAAVMWVESVGNPQAYSRSGAVGLMQVMPRDGIAAEFVCPKGPCFADRPSIAELQDPAFNVDYGARLLADNIMRLGSWRDGLRAYGPKDVGYSYADTVLSVYEQIRQ